MITFTAGVLFSEIMLQDLEMAEKPKIQLDMGDRFPEMNMNTFEIIKHYGYPAEEYDITTEDGYIITIHRIPYGRRSGVEEKPRQPVILQHGFLCSSAVWVLNKPEKSLGFILADSGYDVWLTNFRGNTYGLRHLQLNPENKEFWAFSFDELGYYDLPANIDFVLNKTGFEQTNYVGHSLGSIAVLVMLSTKPEYNYKIRSVMAMAPSISAVHTNSFAVLRSFRKVLFKLVGDFQFLPQGIINKFLASTSKYSPINQMYEMMLFCISGFGSDQLDTIRLPVYFTHMPAGASSRIYLHLLQLVDLPFGPYNFGTDTNMKKYNQAIPPEYKLEQIVAPVAIFWSQDDTLAHPDDLAILLPQIKNLVLNYRVPHPKFNHHDFMWAKDVKKLVYDKMIKVMRDLWKNDAPVYF